MAQDSGPDTKIQFSGDDNHLFFRLGTRLLLSRKLTGSFPEFDRVLPKDQPHSVSINRDEMKAAIERVAQFSDERTRTIRVQVAAGEIKMHSSISETGDSEESLPVEYAGEAVEIGFNAQYLLDFLKAVDQNEVVFRFKDAQSAGELRPSGELNGYVYRYVVMPMRI